MRIRWLIVAIVAVLFASACDWPQFRFGPEHLGSSPDGSIGISNVGTLHLAWTASPGGPLAASPTVASGVVYMPDRDDAILHAYDAAGVRNCTGSTPTCSDLWTGIDAFGVGSISPSVEGDFVYVGSSGIDVYVFDRGCLHSCGYVWIAQTSNQMDDTPVVADGVLFATSDSESVGTLHAYDRADAPETCDQYGDCAPIWTARTPGAAMSAPAIANGIVYVGTTHGLVTFDAAGVTNCSGPPKTCNPLWTAPTSTALGPVAVTNGKVFARTADGIAVFDAGGANNCSGQPVVCQPLWTASTGPTASLPAIAGNVLYLGAKDGKLYAFDARGVTGCSGGPPKHCNPLWTAATGGAVDSAPSVANGVVYVGSDDTYLYAFDANGQTGCSTMTKTCAPLWKAKTGGEVNSSPTIANGFVYVGSDDGTLYAFKKT
jgi:outer membrane protein assembly factor BamB